jgi:type VI secretion system secreted protein Hcp
MAVDMFFKCDKLKGESKDKTYKDAIDVLAWSWGISQSGSTHVGGGSGAGKANFQDISFTKYVCKCSPTLQLFCAGGDHLPEGLMVVRKAGTTPLEYIKIKLTNFIVTSVSTGGSGGEDRLTENITLNFEKVNFAYQPQNDKGAAEGAAVQYTWDIGKNVKA